MNNLLDHDLESPHSMATSPRTALRVPALIVGGGPVGLYASSLLSAYGVRSILAERSLTGASHPRAHLINTRSMELLRELGIEKAIREETPPLSEWRHFRYCTSLLGTQIASQDHMNGDEWCSLIDASPTSMAHLSQPKLEAILKAEAEFRTPEVGSKLLYGYECVHFKQHESGIIAKLRRVDDLLDASMTATTRTNSRPALDDELTVEAGYLLACDGAHSKVRQALGLRLRGPPPLQHFKSVHFVAPHVRKPPCQRPAPHPNAVTRNGVRARFTASSATTRARPSSYALLLLQS